MRRTATIVVFCVLGAGLVGLVFSRAGMMRLVVEDVAGPEAIWDLSAQTRPGVLGSNTVI